MSIASFFGERDRERDQSVRTEEGSPKAKYGRVIDASAQFVRRASLNSQGLDVLSPAERAALYPNQVPTPSTAQPNNVISFPAQPVIGAIVANETVAAPASIMPAERLPFEASPLSSMPTEVPISPVDVSPIGDFPPLQDAA